MEQKHAVWCAPAQSRPGHCGTEGKGGGRDEKKHGPNYLCSAVSLDLNVHSSYGCRNRSSSFCVSAILLLILHIKNIVHNKSIFLQVYLNNVLSSLFKRLCSNF